MRKPLLLCLSICCAHLPFAQPVLQTSLLAGVSVPLHNNAVNGTYNGSGIHFGSSLNYLMGNGALRLGIGTYIGFLDALGTDINYKQTGQAIAEKFGLSAQGLVYNTTPFKSTHILLGPVASVMTAGWAIDLWAKGGYGINEPGSYSVIYKEGNFTNTLYANKAGENRNGLTYSLGGGIRYGLCGNVGLQLAADYFTTATDQVNYNFEREKGLSPLYTRSNNAYIQASAGLVFTIGGTGEKDQTGRKATRNKTQEAYTDKAITGISGQDVEEGADKDPRKDSLFFVPEKLVIKRTRQTQNATFGERSGHSLSSVNNYLTGFVYRDNNGPLVGQCGPSEMPGDPVPGIDVKFLSEDGNGSNTPFQGRTNADGSFALNNIPPGNYRAVIGRDTLPVGVNNAVVNPGYSLLDVPVNECTSANNVVLSENKLFVEIVAAREAGSGMASGRRMVALSSDPLPVTNRAFEINWKNIITSDGRLYAEVTGSREAGTGMASGRRMVLTGDVDGDGIPDYASADNDDEGNLRIVHLHKEGIVHRDLAARGIVNNPLYQGSGTSSSNPMSEGRGASGNNPLYEPKGNLRSSGSHGENPLYEAKSELRVPGSNGAEHTLLLPSSTVLKTVTTNRPVPGNSFDCLPPGSNEQKATVNTTRSNIKRPSRISCLDGTCAVECVAEVNGVEYEAVITGKFRKVIK
ncbi:carboxypeptidase-like regulatory domain-containing protein [Flavitalea flava]